MDMRVLRESPAAALDVSREDRRRSSGVVVTLHRGPAASRLGNTYENGFADPASGVKAEERSVP